MSIVAMMTSRPADAAPRRKRRGADQGADELTGARKAVSQLERYIPSEAVTLYVAILPLTVPKDVPLTQQQYASRWILAIAVAIVAVLFAAGVYKDECRKRGERFKWPWRRASTVLIAFAAWVIAIPASPFNDFRWYTAPIGAAVGVASATAIALIGLWFGPPET